MVVKEGLVTVELERIVEEYALMKYPEVKSIKMIPKIASFAFENLWVLIDELNIGIRPLSLIFCGQGLVAIHALTKIVPDRNLRFSLRH